MAYISGDSEKKRIAEREKHKLQQEIQERCRDMGIRGMNPLKRQSEYQQIEDMQKEENHIKEDMARTREQRIARTARKRKEQRERRPSNWGIERYLKIKQEREKRAYEARKIVL